MEPFPSERLPIELKTEIIRFAIPSSILARFVKGYDKMQLADGLKNQDENELSRIRASCPIIKSICDRIRYLVVCSDGNEVYRLDPVRDTFRIYESHPHDIFLTLWKEGPEYSQDVGLPIRRMLYWIKRPVFPSFQQSYAEMPFNSSLPTWLHTPMLKAFTLVLDTCDQSWHIESFQQYGPKTRNDTLEEEDDGFINADDPARGASWLDVPPQIGFHGYSRGNNSKGGKWPGFRYWTETKKIEFRTLSWPEVQPCVEDCQKESIDGYHPDLIARLWINRPGESMDAEQSQYGWIEVKAPEEGDAPWVEQVATTCTMVRHMLIRMNRLMGFEWHLGN
ncbi:K P-type ATPase (mediates high-affinity potassium or sodium uptake) [Fusarium subglutinans]|uniref:K P-type ATPase (Mediates high-affinity potassium or sodium uptake) n=1 Tax=Gibberella subglutinans TaxID=42677 RepID=A0A8H5QE21_GIBSU|nr:K P-type ATPase (mediates high-affinity potassium or sodium uptake) [Fusarium subglutinans]KAF5614156.1 K P-type ATPase (mediates high-affinity potassium or sodium uptake) [Fusarium subglutinans]